MSYKVAINGFGRIGRNAFKIAMNHPELDVVAVNDLTSTDTLAYLLKHDSNYGTYHAEVSHDEQHLIVEGHKIRPSCPGRTSALMLLSSRPAALPKSRTPASTSRPGPSALSSPARPRAKVSALSSWA
jgi:hypothetical protein